MEKMELEKGLTSVRQSIERTKGVVQVKAFTFDEWNSDPYENAQRTADFMMSVFGPGNVTVLCYYPGRKMSEEVMKGKALYGVFVTKQSFLNAGPWGLH